MANRFLIIVIIALSSSLRASAAGINDRNSSVANPGLTNFFGGSIKSSALLSDTTATIVAQYLRLQLAKDSINTDDTYIGFNPNFSTQYVMNEDAQYFPGYGKVSLCSISSDNVPLAINKLPLPGKQSLAIHLKVNATADGEYRLNMTEMVAIPPLFEVWLMDAYQKDSLDMRQNKTYVFHLTKADTNSYGSKRFSLVIRQNPALGVQLVNFTATKAADGAQIDWTTENEQNYTNFAVERSIDGGVTFSALDGFASSALGTYSFLDKNPALAQDQYRLKMEDLNATVTYSNIVTLIYGTLTTDNTVKNPVSIYPNPVKNTLNLTIDPTSNSNSNSTETQSIGSTVSTSSTGGNIIYNIKIVSNTGSVIKLVTTTQQDWNYDVSGMQPGTYIVQVLNATDKSLVGISKFIKL